MSSSSPTLTSPSSPESNMSNSAHQEIRMPQLAYELYDQHGDYIGTIDDEETGVPIYVIES